MFGESDDCFLGKREDPNGHNENDHKRSQDECPSVVFGIPSAHDPIIDPGRRGPRRFTRMPLLTQRRDQLVRATVPALTKAHEVSPIAAIDPVPNHP